MNCLCVSEYFLHIARLIACAWSRLSHSCFLRSIVASFDIATNALPKNLGACRSTLYACDCIDNYAACPCHPLLSGVTVDHILAQLPMNFLHVSGPELNTIAHSRLYYCQNTVP